jgi:hypothetical protein
MFVLIPVVILLTISFFVLATLNKVEAKGLKTFGWAICVLLWLTAALVLTTALTIMGVNPCGTGKMMSQCPIMSSQCSMGASQCDLSDFKRSRYHRGETDPHHPWRNNPPKGMTMDTSERTMMDSSEGMPMGSMGSMGSKGSMKCPGMADMKDMGAMDMGNKTQETKPVEKK